MVVHDVFELRGHPLVCSNDGGCHSIIFNNELENSYVQCTEAADSVLVKPGVENQLLVTHAKLIAHLEK